MPIILNDLSKNVQHTKKLAMPSYFSKSLTGSGKKTGLLHGSLLPLRKPDPSMTPCFVCYDKFATITSGTAEYELIPMSLIDTGGMTLTVQAVPDAAVEISMDGAAAKDRIWCLVTAKNAVLATDTRTGSQASTVKQRTLYPIYHVTFFTVNKLEPSGEIASWNARTWEAQALETDAWSLSSPKTHASVPIQFDKKKLEDYFSSLTVFEIIANTAGIWQEHVPGIFRVCIGAQLPDEDLAKMAARLNSYSIDLHAYWEIYDIVAKQRPRALNIVCNQNLNLLLNRTLSDLETKKASIPMFTGKSPYVSKDITPSPEQMAAITTTEPCVIVQSGAGSGKSTVIRHRLWYMEQCGVDIGNTMVLSFTNAAADHIKEIAPSVNSKTIASMIHDIYAMNWSHALSTIDTMLNIIHADSTLTGNPVAQNLVAGLRLLRKSVNMGLVALSGLIRDNFDAVISILDRINQTTLELESLICYHAGGNLKEPNALCEHVIMDEVQDNSIFEFIYIIQYIIRHQASLYLVGDGSQTLYEFRASDPKALNCLEMSGVFQCLKLQTNYRSNQNVLDFANLVLATIEANSIARLQLRANSFLVGDFAENVQVSYRQLQNRTSAVREGIPSMLGSIKSWIQEKLDKGEQVCFLAYRRKDLDPFMDYIHAAFPDKSLINIVPAKSFPWAFFSKYVGTIGKDLYHRPGADVTAEIARHMIDNAPVLCRDRQEEFLKALIAEWRQRYYGTLMLMDQTIRTGAISVDEFKQKVFDTLVAFEIENNAMKQRITSMKNQKLKAQNMSDFHFICSTIHSAKGLEFDNVILLYDENGASDEENKRMYYVGLTRAKNAEWILAYNTNRGSSILTAWETMRDAKAEAKKKAEAQAAADTGKSKASLALPVPTPCSVLTGPMLSCPVPSRTAVTAGLTLDLPELEPAILHKNEKEGTA